MLWRGLSQIELEKTRRHKNRCYIKNIHDILTITSIISAACVGNWGKGDRKPLDGFDSWDLISCSEARLCLISEVFSSSIRRRSACSGGGRRACRRARGRGRAWGRIPRSSSRPRRGMASRPHRARASPRCRARASRWSGAQPGTKKLYWKDVKNTGYWTVMHLWGLSSSVNMCYCHVIENVRLKIGDQNKIVFKLEWCAFVNTMIIRRLDIENILLNCWILQLGRLHKCSWI